MTALGQESAQLQEAYPDSADDIAAKQDEIVTAWGNLKDKVSYWRSFDPFGKDALNILWLVILTTKNPFFVLVCSKKDKAWRLLPASKIHWWLQVKWQNPFSLFHRIALAGLYLASIKHKTPCFIQYSVCLYMYFKLVQSLLATLTQHQSFIVAAIKLFSVYHIRDHISFINEMKVLIQSDELAKDVASAESLLERHQEHKVNFP